MKAITFLLSFSLIGCAAGDRFYTVGQRSKDGSVSSAPVIVASINRDATGNVLYEGYGHRYSVSLPDGWTGSTVTRKTFDKNGNQTGEETTPVIAGASSSSVIQATGQAVKENIQAGGNFGLKSGVGAALGPAVGLAP